MAAVLRASSSVYCGYPGAGHISGIYLLQDVVQPPIAFTNVRMIGKPRKGPAFPQDLEDLGVSLPVPVSSEMQKQNRPDHKRCHHTQSIGIRFSLIRYR